MAAIRPMSLTAFMNYDIQVLSGYRLLRPRPPPQKEDTLAKPNYQYEKRQRDIANKKKQEEKRQKKLEKSQIPPPVDPDQPLVEDAQ